MYNALLNILQDNENFIAFRELKNLHPSGKVKSSGIFQRLCKISKHYTNKFPFYCIINLLTPVFVPV